MIDEIARGGAGNVLITSYAALRTHQKHLIKCNWHYVILDEGHTVCCLGYSSLGVFLYLRYLIMSDTQPRRGGDAGR